MHTPLVGFHAGAGERGLRRHAAGPEHGHLVRPDGHGVAEVRRADVRDAQLGRVAPVHGRAVRRGVPDVRSLDARPRIQRIYS